MQVKTDYSNQARRRFLRNLGLLGAVSLVSTHTLIEVSASAQSNGVESGGASSGKRWGLLIDTAKCSAGCDACVSGCNDEHGLDSTGNDETRAQWIRKIDLKDNLTGNASSLPVMCQHCDSAPCVDVCPTGASFKRDDGIVLVNKHTCIGCRYCVMACPYKARSFIHEALTGQKPEAPRGKGTVESCTLCVHRVDATAGSQQPACAEACSKDAHDAIVFGDLNDPDSAISKALAASNATAIRSDLDLNTGVRYTSI
ncbi:4Fe-4S ferredoxin [Chromatiales bacterium (ex Bugula neritina AB1)]|nr:4Fe-4S ferredoxin [Chromatiales bacterium (ex Bugula neritina AB1)]